MSPALSIVIPTLRRHAVLARALGRLEGQRGDFEVLVVDDPERDDADAVAEAVGRRGYPVRQVHGGGPGPAIKRNAGWREARAPLVLFLDDDVLAGPGLIAAHLDAHAREPQETVAVLGGLGWARELRVTPFMRFLEEGIQFDYRAIRGDDAGWGRFYTANLSIKRALLERAGGFDESFPYPSYEDLELARRLHDLGLVLRYRRDAGAEHLHAPTLESVRARMAAVASSERRMTELHPDVAPYFHELFSAAVAAPARGRGRALARFVPERVPVLGPRVWASARAAYRRELGSAFLAAWSGPK